MPTAGDEGYEKLVICPYDKAHEIRQGRMQFHLEKCRKNWPNAEMMDCPFNSAHRIQRVELQYHTEEECENRSIWDKHTHEVGDTECPVKDLVPVNAATVPDGDENWDNYEAQGSVLDTIKTQAAEKDIYRMMQCESKAKRKNFRLNEATRHQELKRLAEVASSSNSSVISNESERDRRQTLIPSVPVHRQNVPDAIANINRQFKKLELKNKQSADIGAQKPSASNERPSVSSPVAEPSTSRLSYASASRPDSPKSDATTSSSTRTNTAMSIEASLNRIGGNNNSNRMPTNNKGFCQIPIPGLGRGRKTKPLNQY